MESLSSDEAKNARDQEIHRLSKLLEAGRPLDEEGAKLAHDANLKLIEQLQDQVDFLNDQLSRKAGTLLLLFPPAGKGCFIDAETNPTVCVEFSVMLF